MKVQNSSRTRLVFFWKLGRNQIGKLKIFNKNLYFFIFQTYFSMNFCWKSSKFGDNSSFFNILAIIKNGFLEFSLKNWFSKLSEKLICGSFFGYCEKFWENENRESVSFFLIWKVAGNTRSGQKQVVLKKCVIVIQSKMETCRFKNRNCWYLNIVIITVNLTHCDADSCIPHLCFRIKC